ncbi:hypothetical protein KFK09_015352 [Dendrobium nobile]|uniref:Uncharacterized protein n=1 Tax=Dendrobium nobile TaxID=94219 RepID=A0A8T3B4J7_DENNO|nr:hypothetical protein KFK09_015352 [Dendrobium nobile]
MCDLDKYLTCTSPKDSHIQSSNFCGVIRSRPGLTHPMKVVKQSILAGEMLGFGWNTKATCPLQ